MDHRTRDERDRDSRRADGDARLAEAVRLLELAGLDLVDVPEAVVRISRARRDVQDTRRRVAA
jgi:hypothetical protein